MNYGQLKQAAYDALIDTPTIVQNAVPRLVNQAIVELEQRFNFLIMQANQAYTTTINSRTLTPSTLPADLKELRGIPFYTENLGSGRDMDFLWGTEIVQRRWNTTDIGDPHSLVSDAGVLTVWPLPDGISDYTNGEYRITLPYWKYLPDLVADSDSNWFTANADQFIINWVVAEGFAIDWDEKRADYWSQRADKEALRAIITGKKQYLSAMTDFAPYQGALEGPATVR